jgi:hypothetical protein
VGGTLGQQVAQLDLIFPLDSLDQHLAHLLVIARIGHVQFAASARRGGGGGVIPVVGTGTPPVG